MVSAEEESLEVSEEEVGDWRDSEMGVAKEESFGTDTPEPLTEEIPKAASMADVCSETVNESHRDEGKRVNETRTVLDKLMGSRAQMPSGTEAVVNDSIQGGALVLQRT